MLNFLIVTAVCAVVIYSAALVAGHGSDRADIDYERIKKEEEFPSCWKN